MIRCDDVFVDIDVDQFEKICQIVRRHDFDHLISVTPKGEGKRMWKPRGRASHLLWKMHFKSNSLPDFVLNYRIERMCGEHFIGDNAKLVRLLNTEFSKDDVILALHGLHHYRYTNLPRKKVREELSEGVQLLESLFGEKAQIFAPPFNAWNYRIELICRSIDLSIDKYKYAGFDNLIQDMNDSQIIELAKRQSHSKILYHPQALTSLEKFDLYLKTRRKYC